ncbi:MAG: carboxypeptidase regulatory-like domain-containing protein [Terracidiphilus sp.]|jgi:hypothetical protein
MITNTKLFRTLIIGSLMSVGLVTLTLAPPVASAQTSNGTLTGTVNDPSGAAIVGASVSIQSVETGTTHAAVTIRNGTYRIESILPGTYSIAVNATGFAQAEIKDLVIPASVVTTSDVTLKLGGAHDVVQVSADNSNLDTDNAQISGIIGSEEISSLPLNSLSAYQTALTLPGVTSAEQGAFSNGVNFAVGGGRPRANNFLIEGQDNNDAGIMGQGLQPGNIEAQKEIIIIENDYTAEYGHGAGSVSNLIFKSGTNQFHGSVFERLQNSSIDATDHYDVRNDIPKSLYRENQFGFSIGGPVIKGKLFFFGSYQWDNYRSTANGNPLLVPSAAGFATLKALPTLFPDTASSRLTNLVAGFGTLVGDPAQLASLGGTTEIPLGIDPAKGTNRGNVEVGSAVRSVGTPSNSPELDLKGDYIPSTKDTLSLRYIRTSFETPVDFFNSPGQLPGFDTDQNGTAHNAGIVETHTFNSALLNEFRASYGRIGFTFGLPSTTTSNPLFGLPILSVSNLTGYGIPDADPQGRFHNTVQFQDSLSWTHGRHFFKVGFDIADIRVRDEIPFNFYGTIGYLDVAGGYAGLANLLDDYAGKGTISQNFGSPIARPRLLSQNYFGQDTWKARSNLSIDFGLRYEYNGAPFNASTIPYPGIDYSNPSCFPTTGVTCNDQQRSDGTQWGPRFGISYSPSILGSHKTVLRGGGGVFYDVLFTNIADNTQAAAPNTASPEIISNPSATLPRGIAAWSTQFSALDHSPLPTNFAEPISDHLLAPETFHWNLGVQQELPGAFTLQASYVGERGEHLFGTTEFNPYVNDFFSAARLINSRGRIAVRDNSGDSNYNALWAELDHMSGHHLLFRASYTYGRAEDDVSEIFTDSNAGQSTYGSASYPVPRKSVDYGLSAYDHRQRLVLSYVWTPPIWHTEGSMKVLGNIANRWSIAGITQFQSGSPENVEVGYDVNGDGISNDRPVIGNPKAPLQTYAFDDSWFYGTSDGGLCEGSELWYTNDPCHVVTPSQVHWIVPAYGTRPSDTVGRNNLIGPGYQTWDMSINRSFKLWEHATLDFRGELFNIFNHSNFSVGNAGFSSGYSTLTSLIYGIPYTAGGFGNATFAEYAPLYGGNRHTRFYLRISF